MELWKQVWQAGYLSFSRRRAPASTIERQPEMWPGEDAWVGWKAKTLAFALACVVWCAPASKEGIVWASGPATHAAPPARLQPALSPALRTKPGAPTTRPAAIPPRTQPTNPRVTGAVVRRAPAGVRPRPATRPGPRHHKAKGCIKGRILGPKGLPQANVLIATHPSSGPMFTDQKGLFVLCFRRLLDHPSKRILRRALPKGRYVLSAFQFGYQMQRHAFVFHQRDIQLPDLHMTALRPPLCVAALPGQRAGRKHGVGRRCWPNGGLMLSERWSKGLREGAMSVATASGRRYEQLHFRRGRRHGRYTRWGADGRKLCTWRFANDRPQGALRCQVPPRPTSAPASLPVQRPLPQELSQRPTAWQRALLEQIAQDRSPHKLTTRPWIAWIRPSGPNAHITRPFVVPRQSRQGLSVRVVALGEARHQQMTDTAWIEHRQTGQIVWQMRWSSSRVSGPDPRNRIVDQSLTLAPGAYLLHYTTDASHDPSFWITAPPAQPSRYGVTLYLPDSLGYQQLSK